MVNSPFNRNVNILNFSIIQILPDSFILKYSMYSDYSL
jgi:hypothetical protein